MVRSPVEERWPDYPERSARTNLSNALSNLRTALGDRKALAACDVRGLHE